MKKCLVFLCLLFAVTVSNAEPRKIPGKKGKVIEKSVTKNIGTVTFFKLDKAIIKKYGLSKGNKAECGSIEFGWALQYNCILYGAIYTGCDGTTWFVHHENDGLDQCFGNEAMIC